MGTRVNSIIFNLQLDHLPQHSTYPSLNDATLRQPFPSDLSYSFHDYAIQKTTFREWLGSLAQSFSYLLLVSWASGCEAISDG